MVGMTLYKFSVGAVLAVAMVGVLGASAIMFSARDFQFGVAQVAPSTNGRVDFAALDRVEREIAVIQDQPEQAARVQALQAEIVPEGQQYERIKTKRGRCSRSACSALARTSRKDTHRCSRSCSCC
jgi:hypothetical protein